MRLANEQEAAVARKRRIGRLSMKEMGRGIVSLPKEDPWASIAKACALADLRHPIRRHKPPAQRRSLKWR
jgi:hypothetical protein